MHDRPADPLAGACEIVTIGDELTRGEILDTNARFLAERLTDLGLDVAWMTSCRDEKADIVRALEQACARARLVFVSGGLGPTEDDRTVDALAELSGRPAETDDAALKAMQKRFERAGFALTPNNLRQVRVIAGAQVLPNRVGLAPGFRVGVRGTELFILPGVPREMESIFIEEIAPLLAAQPRHEHIAVRTLRTYGLGESHVDHKLAGLASGQAGVSIHYRVVFPENWVKLVVRDADRACAQARLGELEEQARARLGHHIYGIDGETFGEAVGRVLRAHGATLALAESCTGGLVSHLVTNVAGSSDYFRMGIVSYSNESKRALLGVREETLREHGAVSDACVTEMAEGVRRVAGATLGVAISGIAGPGGGSAEKPVGTVHFALAAPWGTRTEQALWPGGRVQIKTRAAHAALALALFAWEGRTS